RVEKSPTCACHLLFFAYSFQTLLLSLLSIPSSDVACIPGQGAKCNATQRPMSKVADTSPVEDANSRGVLNVFLAHQAHAGMQLLFVRKEYVGVTS
ncbi:uncharacterized protein EI90DRAFT_3065589, partial [Cantharellus anzutake]|uniref:uncharacterized protein n=1 Tax=Cantharellus anzutake TaxID=1750568 RepID=UPI0019083108